MIVEFLKTSGKMGAVIVIPSIKLPLYPAHERGIPVRMYAKRLVGFSTLDSPFIDKNDFNSFVLGMSVS